MTAPDSLPLHALTEDNLATASPDLLRQMVKAFAEALMSAEADAACNAPYGQVSDTRVNQRNGYRPREWDTRTGTIELAIPKLRSGSYFPAWLLERRRRAEQALISVVATALPHPPVIPQPGTNRQPLRPHEFNLSNPVVTRHRISHQI